MSKKNVEIPAEGFKFFKSCFAGIIDAFFFHQSKAPIQNEEIEQEEQTQEENQKKIRGPDDPPERPDNNGYQMFTKFARMKLRRTHPNLHFGAINHHLGLLWKKEEIKEVWIIQYRGIFHSFFFFLTRWFFRKKK